MKSNNDMSACVGPIASSASMTFTHITGSVPSTVGERMAQVPNDLGAILSRLKGLSNRIKEDRSLVSANEPDPIRASLEDHAEAIEARIKNIYAVIEDMEATL